MMVMLVVLIWLSCCRVWMMDVMCGLQLGSQDLKSLQSTTVSEYSSSFSGHEQGLVAMSAEN